MTRTLYAAAIVIAAAAAGEHKDTPDQRNFNREQMREFTIIVCETPSPSPADVWGKNQ